MPGNISRWYLKSIKAAFIVFPNGEELAFKFVSGPLGELDFAVWMKEYWDEAFKTGASYPIYSQDQDVTIDIITTGNLWNNPSKVGDPTSPTWRELYNGDKSIIVNGEAISGGPAMNYQLQQWLKSKNVETCEASTDVAWWQGDVIAYAQPRLEAVYDNWVREPKPADPTPPEADFPAAQVGLIQGAMGLAIAQSTRVRGTIVNGRPKIVCIPVPQA